jgi:RHS repeat-associated protein
MKLQTPVYENAPIFFEYAQEKKDMRTKSGIDYFTFGAAQTGRTGGDSYRYKFNGMETDPESKNGEGLDYTTEYRSYDPRVGRWFSPDPILKYWESPYAAYANNPVIYTDPSGLDPEGDPHKNDHWVDDGPSTRNENIHTGHWEHNVTDGETPYGIATERGLTLDQLASMNPGIFHGYDQKNPDPHYWDASNKNNYMLHTGDQLRTSTSGYNMPTGSYHVDMTDITGCSVSLGICIGGVLVPWEYDPHKDPAWLDERDAFIEKIRHQPGGDLAWDKSYDPNVTSGESKINFLFFASSAYFCPASGAYRTAITALKPLGLGSTGRTVANTLAEQLAMKEILANPAMGKVVMTGMNDARWLGWSKMQYVKTLSDGTKIVIHYVAKIEDGVITLIDDFKFK